MFSHLHSLLFYFICILLIHHTYSWQHHIESTQNWWKYGEIINFETIGGIPGTQKHAIENGILFNTTLNKLLPGQVFYFPNKNFFLTGGMKVDGLNDVAFVIDGKISFVNDRETWPLNEKGHVEECLFMRNLSNVTFTSNGHGVIDGNGQSWWGAINFLKHQEDRPRLVHLHTSENLLIENLTFKDSPFWTFYSEKSNNLIIRNSHVDARWTQFQNHSLIDLQAFNTDGFDVTGKNVYIHDSNIWCQDDCISVKDGSENMLFERINCSGLGLVVGSIGSSVVKNITFRDSYMPKTVKGIYMKTRWYDEIKAPLDVASITDILYENIIIDEPEQYGIWMGPAQQTDQPCSLLWTKTKNAKCPMSGYQTWDNIVLKNIVINNPKRSPGMLMGNSSNPMKNIIFDNVYVNNPGNDPWGDSYYYCDSIQGVAKGKTWPIPPCFTQE